MGSPLGRDIEQLVARVTPAIEALLQDGVPRSKRAIAAELARVHSKHDLVQTIMRMAVTGRLVEIGSKYTLPADKAGVSDEA